MIVRVKGSHDLFRGICQFASTEGTKRISSANSIGEITTVHDDIINELLEHLSFSYGYRPIEGTDVDVFPDCDFEEDLLNYDNEIYDNCEELYTLFKFEMAVTQLAEEILGRIAGKGLQTIEGEVA